MWGPSFGRIASGWRDKSTAGGGQAEVFVRKRSFYMDSIWVRKWR